MVACIAALVPLAERSVYGTEVPDAATLGGKPAKTFSTAGHPKAKGMDLTISYPADWSAEETDRPIEVQTFINPTSTAMVMLFARPLTRPLTQDEISKMVATQESVALLLSSRATIESFEPAKVGEEPAAYVESTHSREQSGKMAYSRSLFLVIPRTDTVVMINCMVASPDQETVEKTFEAHREIYKQMLGSVVLGKGLK